MRVERVGGRVRVDAETFEALVHAVDDAPVSPDLRSLAQDPAVRARLTAVLRPTAQATVTLAGRGGVIVHQVWLGAGTGTALAHVRGGLGELLEVPPVLLPRTLARFVGLGPRPRLSGGQVRPGDDALAALSSQDAEERRDAAEVLAGAASPWSTFAGSLREGRWRAWQVTASWPGAGSDDDGLDDDGADGSIGGIALAVVDTPGGMAEVGPDGTLTGTDPSTVWAALTRTVPVAAITAITGGDARGTTGAAPRP